MAHQKVSADKGKGVPLRQSTRFDALLQSNNKKVSNASNSRPGFRFKNTPEGINREEAGKGRRESTRPTAATNNPPSNHSYQRASRWESLDKNGTAISKVVPTTTSWGSSSSSRRSRDQWNGYVARLTAMNKEAEWSDTREKELNLIFDEISSLSFPNSNISASDIGSCIHLLTQLIDPNQVSISFRVVKLLLTLSTPTKTARGLPMNLSSSSSLSSRSVPLSHPKETTRRSDDTTAFGGEGSDSGSGGGERSSLSQKYQEKIGNESHRTDAATQRLIKETFQELESSSFPIVIKHNMASSNKINASSNSKKYSPSPSPNPSSRSSSLLSTHSSLSSSLQRTSLVGSGGGGGMHFSSAMVPSVDQVKDLCLFQQPVAVIDWLFKYLEISVDNSTDHFLKDVMRSFTQVFSVSQHVTCLIQERPSLFRDLIAKISSIQQEASSKSSEIKDVQQSIDIDIVLYTLELFTVLSISTKSLHLGEMNQQLQDALLLAHTSERKASTAKEVESNLDDMKNIDMKKGDDSSVLDDGGFQYEIKSSSREFKASFLVEKKLSLQKEVDAARFKFWTCAVDIFHQYRKEYLRAESTQSSRLLLRSMHSMKTLILSEHEKEVTPSNTQRQSNEDKPKLAKKAKSKDSIPLNQRTVIASLLIGLHHLLQPRRDEKEAVLYPAADQRLNSQDGSLRDRTPDGSFLRSQSRGSSRSLSSQTIDIHESIQLQALSLLASLATEYPKLLYEKWHLFLPINSDMSRLKRSLALSTSSNLKSSKINTTRLSPASLSTSCLVVSDIPQDAPLPYLLLPSLQPCSMVRAAAAHAVAQLVSKAPLQKWLGGALSTTATTTFAGSSSSKDISAQTSNRQKASRLTHPGQLAQRVGDMLGTLHELIATAFFEENDQANSEGVRLALCTAVVGLLNNTPYATFKLQDIISVGGGQTDGQTPPFPTLSGNTIKKDGKIESSSLLTTSKSESSSNKKMEMEHIGLLQAAVQLVDTPSYILNGSISSNKISNVGKKANKINVSQLRLLEQKLGLFGKEFLKIVSAVTAIWFIDAGASTGEASTDQSVAQTLLTLLSTRTPLVVVDFFLQLNFPAHGNVCAGNLIQRLLAVARGDGLSEDTPITIDNQTMNASPSQAKVSQTASISNSQSFRGFSLSIRSEALWMLGRLARTYPWRVAQEWERVDLALRKCYRCADPILRLHAIKVGEEMLGACARALGHHTMTISREPMNQPELENNEDTSDPTTTELKEKVAEEVDSSTYLSVLLAWSKSHKSGFVDNTLRRSCNDPNHSVRAVAISCFGYLLPEDWENLSSEIRLRSLSQVFESAISDSDGTVSSLACRVIGVLGSFWMFSDWPKTFALPRKPSNHHVQTFESWRKASSGEVSTAFLDKNKGKSNMSVGFMEQVVITLSEAVQSSKVAVRSQAFWAVGNVAAGMSSLYEYLQEIKLQSTSKPLNQSASHQEGLTVLPASGGISGGIGYDVYELWALKLGRVVLAGFDEQHKVASSAVRASSFIAPHLLVSCLLYGKAVNTRIAKDISGHSDVESASDNEEELLNDLVFELIAKVRLSFDSSILSRQHRRSNMKPSSQLMHSFDFENNIKLTNEIDSDSQADAHSLHDHVMLTSNSDVCDLQEFENIFKVSYSDGDDRPTVGATGMKLSWNACHALGCLFDVMQGEVLSNLLAKIQLLSSCPKINHKSAVSSFPTNVDARATPLSASAKKNKKKKAKKKGNVVSGMDLDNESFEMSFDKMKTSDSLNSASGGSGTSVSHMLSRLDSFGLGGGNPEAVQKQKWKQLQKERHIGSLLIWFDASIHALIAAIINSESYKIKLHAVAALQRLKSGDAYGGNLVTVFQCVISQLKQVKSRALYHNMKKQSREGVSNVTPLAGFFAEEKEEEEDSMFSKYGTALLEALLRLLRHLLYVGDLWLDLLPVAELLAEGRVCIPCHAKTRGVESSGGRVDGNTIDTCVHGTNDSDAEAGGFEPMMFEWSVKDTVDEALDLKPPPLSSVQKLKYERRNKFKKTSDESVNSRKPIKVYMGDLDGGKGTQNDTENDDEKEYDFGWRNKTSRRRRTIVILTKLCRIVEYNEKSQGLLGGESVRYWEKRLALLEEESRMEKQQEKTLSAIEAREGEDEKLEYQTYSHHLKEHSGKSVDLYGRKTSDWWTEHFENDEIIIDDTQGTNMKMPNPPYSLRSPREGHHGRSLSPVKSEESEDEL